jgi:hypothetical protein
MSFDERDSKNPRVQPTPFQEFLKVQRGWRDLRGRPFERLFWHRWLQGARR